MHPAPVGPGHNRDEADMIPITPEIIGPGIEEEYQDALIRINPLLEIASP
jgi:hypothetical protein